MASSGDEAGQRAGRAGFRPAPVWRRQTAPPAQVLRAMYVEQGRTKSQIAHELGVSRELVASALREAGVSRRDGKRACPVSPEELRRLFVNEKVSVRALTRRWHAGAPTVNRWLAEAGLVGPSDYLDAEQLRHLYVELGLTTSEVARRLECSVVTVKTAMERAGIPRRPRSGTAKYSEHRAAITDDRLRHVYLDDGLSLHQAAAELGVSTWYLQRRLAAARLAKHPGSFVQKTPYTRTELRAKAADLYATGMSMHAIALALGVAQSTVRIALHEARVPIRRGRGPTLEGATERLLIDDLYADARIVECLRRHDVQIPGLAGWEPAGPNETLAPLPLSAALVRELYQVIGLATLHIALLCGIGMGTVAAGLAAAGITPRASREPCPWLAATYGANPAARPPAPPRAA